MADDNSNHIGEFLTGLRDSVANGESVYGPIGSPRQVEKLAELDAKLALGRQLGEIAPAPEPWSVNRAAGDRLAAEFPGGDPAQDVIPQMKVEWLTGQIDRLSASSTLDQAALAQQVADDLAHRASAVSVRHSPFNRETGAYPTGRSIVDALIRDAEPAVNVQIAPERRQKTLQLLRCDRQLLELFAVRGRNMTAYASRKAQLGLIK